MVEFAPASGGLALWVHHRDVEPEDDPQLPRSPTGWGAGLRSTPPVAPIWTDGTTLHYRPAFDALPLDEQTGWVAHEVLHIALRHAQRYGELQRRLGDVDLQLYNLCADAIVNSTLSHLGWMQLPRGSLTLEALLEHVLNVLQSPESALLDWDVERLYRAIDDRRPTGRAAGGRSARAQQGGAGEGSERREATRAASGGEARAATDATLEDGPRAAMLRQAGAHTAADLHPAHGESDAIDEAERSRDWAERVLRGHANDGAFSMLRTLGADLPKSRTPWEQVLRTRLNRALARKPGVSWSRPARSYLANQGRMRGSTNGARSTLRMPWLPGTTASRAVPRLALVIDVSGSIDDALLARFATELRAITRRLEAPVIAIIGDDAVHAVRTFAPGKFDLEGFVVAGRGGTDFTPLLEEASRHAPDLVVVLTDLDGPARHRPVCPVLWAVPDAYARAVVPFGRLLALD
jgi:predicted metal-dependent peptidase